MSRNAKIAVKILFSLALLGFLGSRMDLEKFFQVLSSARFPLLLLAATVQITAILLSVARWQAVLRNFSILTNFVSLVRLSFIGYFWGLFLPTHIGGDFVRAYYLSRKEKRAMSTTATSIVLDRSAGLCALLGIGIFFAALHRLEVQGIGLFHFFLLVSLVYVLSSVAMFHSWTHKLLSRFVTRLHLENMAAKLELAYQGLHTLRRNGRAIFVILLLSMMIQFLAVVVVWIAAQAIQIAAPFYFFLVCIPAINLSTSIPVTINGIGLRESLYYLFFSEIGLPVETAVTLSLLSLLVMVLAAMPGMVMYSFYKKEEHFDEVMARAETP